MICLTRDEGCQDHREDDESRIASIASGVVRLYDESLAATGANAIEPTLRGLACLFDHSFFPHLVRAVYILKAVSTRHALTLSKAKHLTTPAPDHRRAYRAETMADLDLDIPDIVNTSLSSLVDYVTATATSSALLADVTGFVNGTLGGNSTSPLDIGDGVLNEGISQGNPVVSVSLVGTRQFAKSSRPNNLAFAR